MTAPSQELCAPWAAEADMPCDPTELGIDAAVVTDALLVASSILYNMTLMQWPGPCQSIVRPCSRYESSDTMRRAGVQLEAGSWRCSCRGQSPYQPGCYYLSQIELGQSPIATVDEVLIDGEVIDPARYRVDDFRWLVFMPDPTGVDEHQGWPCCQRMDLETTEVGTFEVTVTVGTVPDRGGVRAAGHLACELAKLWTPTLAGSCQLNGRVTSMTRQQVSMTVSDPSGLLTDGLIGLVDVDMWVQGVLRAHRSRHAAVVVPERRRQSVRRTTS